MEAGGWLSLCWVKSGAKSLSKVSSNKGSRHGHVKSSISSLCFSVGGVDRLFDGTAASGTGEALGLLVPGTVYVFLVTEAGLLGNAVSLHGTVTGLEIRGSITGKAFFGNVSGLELLGTLAELETLGTVTGLEIFGTGLESLGIDTGLALFGTVLGPEILGTVTGLFETGLESLGTVIGLPVCAAASGL